MAKRKVKRGYKMCSPLKNLNTEGYVARPSSTRVKKPMGEEIEIERTWVKELADKGRPGVDRIVLDSFVSDKELRQVMKDGRKKKK